jgi:hypothetical protein
MHIEHRFNSLADSKPYVHTQKRNLSETLDTVCLKRNAFPEQLNLFGSTDLRLRNMLRSVRRRKQDICFPKAISFCATFTGGVTYYFMPRKISGGSSPFSELTRSRLPIHILKIPQSYYQIDALRWSKFYSVSPVQNQDNIRSGQIFLP